MIAVMQIFVSVPARIFSKYLVMPVDFKPFSCQACLSFWLTVLFETTLGMFMAHWIRCIGIELSYFLIIMGFMWCGSLLGFINFLMIRYKIE